MATNEWGMLRDIFNEVADDNFETANLFLPDAKPLGSGRNPYLEARVTAHLTVAHAFRNVADKMRERGGPTPDELSAEWRKKLEIDQSTGDTASSMSHARFVEAIMGDMLDDGSKLLIAQEMDKTDEDTDDR